jgi:hypothetical protein
VSPAYLGLAIYDAVLCTALVISMAVALVVMCHAAAEADAEVDHHHRREAATPICYAEHADRLDQGLPNPDELPHIHAPANDHLGRYTAIIWEPGR